MCEKQSICGYYKIQEETGECPRYPECSRLNEPGMKQINRNIEESYIFESEIKTAVANRDATKGLHQ